MLTVSALPGAAAPTNLHWESVKRALTGQFRDLPTGWLDNVATIVRTSSRSNKLHAFEPSSGCVAKTESTTVVKLAEVDERLLCAKCVTANRFRFSFPKAFTSTDVPAVLSAVTAAATLAELLAHPIVVYRHQARVPSLLNLMRDGVEAAGRVPDCGDVADHLAAQIGAAAARIDDLSRPASDLELVAAYHELLDVRRCIDKLPAAYRKTRRRARWAHIAAMCAGQSTTAPVDTLREYLRAEGYAVDASHLAATLPVSVYADLIDPASPLPVVDVIAANMDTISDRIVNPAADAVLAYACTMVRRWAASPVAVVAVTASPVDANLIEPVFTVVNPAGVKVHRVAVSATSVRLVLVGPSKLVRRAVDVAAEKRPKLGRATAAAKVTVAGTDPAAARVLVELASVVTDHEAWAATALAA